MSLINTNLHILGQLKSLVKQFSDSDYSKPLDILSGNSIGKHVRHVVEFYECLLKGLHQSEINYDKRERNLQLETNVSYTVQLVESIMIAIEQHKNDSKITLTVIYEDEVECNVDSTYYRELVYNIEHAIHHFAILSIAVKNSFPEIMLAPNFGTAYSTIQYQESTKCAQ